MNEMIKICKDYAADHNSLLNGKKSKYLVFENYEYSPTIMVNNLGHTLNTKYAKNALIDESIKTFNNSFYGFMSKFDRCNTTVRNKLFHQYCSSMYGSHLWDLTNKNVENMCIQWRNAHRRVLSVPGRTHCDLLPLIADNMPLEVKLDCKYIVFFQISLYLRQ